MDLTLDDILDLLATLGIHSIPRNTKLSIKELDRRLSSAINSCQGFSEAIHSFPIKPSDYSPWYPPKSEERPLMRAMSKWNIAEIAYRERLDGASEPSRAPKDTFIEMKLSLMQIAEKWDRGHNLFLVQDGDLEQWAIALRIVEVLAVKDGRPLWTVLYKYIPKPDGETLHKITEKYFEKGTIVITLTTATPLERKMIYKLLSMNSSRLSQDYSPKRNRKEESFSLSFILPIGTMEKQDIIDLNRRTGCAVCSKKESSLCSQCMSIFYCSRECQMHDWKSHKRICQSLKGGTWSVINMATTFDLEQKEKHQFLVNFSDPTVGGAEIRSPDDEAPSDIHNGNIFLVKIQIPIPLMGMAPVEKGPILVYDRERSFKFYIHEQDNRGIYDEIVHITKTTGVSGIKMFRWAKRVGDFRLNICLDRPSAQNPSW